MQLYPEWRRQLVDKLKQGEAVKLWDFSGDVAYRRETVPEPGAAGPPLDWFWEPAHYRRELGDLMLQSMLQDSCDLPTGFGVRLL